MVWSEQQRVFEVRGYFENGESIVQTQRDFRTNFNILRHGTISDRNTILRWVTVFNTTGTVLMKRTNRRNRAIRTLENVDSIRLDTLRSPNRSVSLHAVALGINESSVRQILKIDLAFHPYKIQVCHQLLAGDNQQHINFAQLMI